MKCLVIADDFTGANDTGMQLARRGCRTEVFFQVPEVTKADTSVIIDTESRHLACAEAYEKVYNIVSDSLAKYDITIKVDTLDTGYYAPGGLAIGGGAEAKGSLVVKDIQSGNIVCNLKVNYIKGQGGAVIDHQRFGLLSFAILKEMYDLATAKKK